MRPRSMATNSTGAHTSDPLQECTGPHRGPHKVPWSTGSRHLSGIPCYFFSFLAPNLLPLSPKVCTFSGGVPQQPSDSAYAFQPARGGGRGLRRSLQPVRSGSGGRSEVSGRIVMDPGDVPPWILRRLGRVHSNVAFGSGGREGGRFFSSRANSVASKKGFTKVFPHPIHEEDIKGSLLIAVSLIFGGGAPGDFYFVLEKSLHTFASARLISQFILCLDLEAAETLTPPRSEQHE